MTTAMVQDKQGFLWIGSNTGLFRYDGAAFKQYRYVPGIVNTLGNELVTALATNDKYLFIGTQNGLSILDFQTDSIINFHSGKPDPNSPEGKRINDLLWHKDILWILGKDFTLTSYDPSKKIFTRFNLRKPEPITENHIVIDIRKLIPDLTNQNFIWAVSTFGLYRFNISDNSSLLISPPGKGYFNTQNTYGMSMVQGTDGTFWIGGVIEKLFSYHPIGSQWEEYRYEPSNRNDSNVTSIYNLQFYDSSHLLLFTSLARYQHLFDIHRKIFFPMTDRYRRNGRTDLFYISGVRFIYNDRNENTWFGHGEGFSRIIKEKDPFTFYQFWINGKRPKNNNYQQVFLEDVPNKLLFIGTRNGDGLWVRDFGKKTLEMIHSSFWTDTTKYDLVVDDLLQDEKGILWTATQKGLFTWERGWERFYPYENHLIRDHIYSMVSNKEGLLFLGTKDKGLLVLNLTTKKMISEFNGLIPFRNIRALCLDSAEILWVGGDGGLGLVDLSRRKFIPLNKDRFGLLSNDHFNVADIIQDNEGRIWISTNTTGIFCMEQKNGKWTAQSFNTSNGMPDNNISRLVLDKNGHIWAGTTSGIVRIIPGNSTITTFTTHDGLGFANRVLGGKYAMSNGYILLGANRSYEIFHPDSLISNSSKAIHPYIFSFKVAGTDGNYFSEINSGRPIVLPYNMNRFEAELGMLDFTPNRKIQYEYRLVNYDKEWIRTSSRNYVVYGNLPPGKYQFEYTALNLNRSGIKTINRIPLIIQAPWWQQWWFRTILVLGLAGLALQIYANYRKKKERLLQQKEREERFIELNRQMNEMRLMAIRSQMNPHFIFNCLNSIQKMIVVEDVNGAYQYLSKFSKLLRMVLDNSEKNFISLTSEMEMNVLYLELESLRFKNSFEYQIEIDKTIDPESTTVPSLLLQPFIENAIWHGLMHREGEKKLWIRFSRQANQLVCTIEDNGVGREKSAAIKAQKLGSHYFESKGTKLSEQRIELLNQQLEQRASILITDLSNGSGSSGTRITIELPIQVKTNNLDKDSDSR